MLSAYGLYGHIRANRIRSMVLLAGFVVLLQVLQFSVYLLGTAFLEWGYPFERIVAEAYNNFKRTWPIATLIALAWFIIAYFVHHSMISSATGARAVTRVEAPALYNALENLCISRGIPMPRLEIIDSDGLNAYAAGLRDDDQVIAVTRGLVERLKPDELEAVIAHELTHIRNKDSQLMVVAVIFAGIFAFVGDLVFRAWDFPYGMSPTDRYSRSRRDTSSDDSSEWRTGGTTEDRRDDKGGGGGGGALIAIAVAVAIILITWGVSTVIRFAISRSREFLADAGAAELTKNPDAMIRALRKISQNPNVDVISRMEAFFIATPLPDRINYLMSTHPSIEDRIEALQRFAGGAKDIA